MWPLGKTEWLLATLTSMEACGQTKRTKTQTKGTKEVSLLWNKVYQKSIRSCKDYLTSGLGLSGWFKSLWELHKCFQQLNLEQYLLRITVELGCWGLWFGTHYCAPRYSAILLLVLVRRTGEVNPFLDKYRPIALLSWKSQITQCNYSVTNLNY